MTNISLNENEPLTYDKLKIIVDSINRLSGDLENINSVSNGRNKYPTIDVILENKKKPMVQQPVQVVTGKVTIKKQDIKTSLKGDVLFEEQFKTSAPVVICTLQMNNRLEIRSCINIFNVDQKGFKYEVLIDSKPDTLDELNIHFIATGYDRS